MSGQRFGSVLLRRASQIGARRAAQAADWLGERMSAELPGIAVQVERGQVHLIGRRLRRRWLTDAGLRWLGRLLR